MNADRYICRFLLILTALAFLSSIPFVHAEPPHREPYQRLPKDPGGHQKTLDLAPEERAWLADHKTIRIAFDGYFPPYSFLNGSGEIEGLAVDVINILAERLGINLEVCKEFVWNELFSAATRKEVDVVATMGHRPERDQWFAFTPPYIFKSLVIMSRSNDTAIRMREDIADKRVALVQGYQYVPGILKDFPTLTPYYVDTMLDGLNAVATGTADAAVTFFGAGHHLVTTYGIANLKFAAVYDRNSFLECIAVRKDWPELAAVFAKALAVLDPEELKSLQVKWNADEALLATLEDRISPQEQALFIALVLLLFLALLAFVVVTFWNKSLRRKVEIRTKALEIELAERARIEKVATQNEKRLSEAQHAADIGSWELNLNDDSLWWSGEVYRIFEIEPKQFDHSYASFQAAIHPEDRHPFDRAYKESVALRTDFKINHRLLFADGRVKHVSVQGKTVYDDDGRPLRSIGTVQDITVRIELTDALRESEEKYRRIFETMADGYILADLDGNIQMVNPATISMLRYDSAAALLVKNMARDIFAQPLLREELKAVLVRQGAVSDFEIEMRLGDGTSMIASANIHLVHDRTGAPQFLEGTFRDITESRKITEEYRSLNITLEQRVQERTAELEEKNQHLQRFNRLLVDRELRMIELKVENRRLQERLTAISDQENER